MAPVGTPDWIGAFAVTAGINVPSWVQRYEADHDDYHAIMTKALCFVLLADRLQLSVQALWSISLSVSHSCFATRTSHCFEGLGWRLACP